MCILIFLILSSLFFTTVIGQDCEGGFVARPSEIARPYPGFNIQDYSFEVGLKYNSIQKVKVKCLVNKQGYLIDPKVVMGSDLGLDSIIESKVLEMPKWIPAKRRGRSVCSQVVLFYWFYDGFLEFRTSIEGDERRIGSTWQELIEEIEEKIAYPKTAQEEGLTDIVNVTFCTDTNGLINCVGIEEPKGFEIRSSIERMLHSMNISGEGTYRGSKYVDTRSFSISFGYEIEKLRGMNPVILPPCERIEKKYETAFESDLKCNKVYDIVDVKPVPPNGLDIINYFKRTVPKPLNSQEKNNRIVLSLVIKDDGYLDSIQILKGVDSVVNEFIRAELPKLGVWQPGIKDNERVCSRFILPIKFDFDKVYERSEVDYSAVSRFVDKEGSNKVYCLNLKDQERYTGTVGMTFVVDTNGTVKDFQKIDPYSRFEGMAIDFVKQMDWLPAIRNCTKVPCREYFMLNINRTYCPSINELQFFHKDGYVVNKWSKDVVSSLPHFKEGDNSMQWFIKNTMKIPKSAKKILGLDETVIVGFDVSENGNIEHIRINEGKYQELNDEAIRIVDAMPRWVPGRNLDGPIYCKNFALPIRFQVLDHRELSP